MILLHKINTECNLGALTPNRLLFLPEYSTQVLIVEDEIFYSDHVITPHVQTIVDAFIHFPLGLKNDCSHPVPRCCFVAMAICQHTWMRPVGGQSTTRTHSGMFLGVIKSKVAAMISSKGLYLGWWDNLTIGTVAFNFFGTGRTIKWGQGFCH